MWISTVKSLFLEKCICGGRGARALGPGSRGAERRARGGLRAPLLSATRPLIQRACLTLPYHFHE